MKFARFALPFMLAASSFAAQASVEVINTDSAKAGFSSKLFSGQATWNYNGAFDLDLTFNFTGTGSFNWTLTEVGVGSESGGYTVSKTVGSSHEETWQDLAAGKYVFSYSGSLAKGSTFSETLISSRSPIFVPTNIPEPATYSMLFAGLGVIGLIVRRRTRS